MGTSQPLFRLSSEILALILDQLRAVDHRSVFVVRLVCRILDSLATPVAYRAIQLNHRIIHPSASSLYPGLLDHVSCFTHEVTVRSDLPSTDVRRLLSVIERLSLVRWSFVSRNNSDLRLPWDILDADQVERSGTSVAVENLPLGGANCDLDESCFISPALTRRMVSLKLSSPKPPLTTRSGSVKRLVLQSPHLRTMHYRDLGIGTSFSFGGSERLPAVVDLVLQSYNWDHSADEVVRHWDFSRIRSLELVNMPVANFLASVRLGDFARLHTLRVEDYGGHLQETRPGATLRLCELVRDHVEALETLDITCHTQLFELEAIGRHQDSLRVLRYRDHVGFDDDNKRCPTLARSELTALGQRLGHVHTLELDMDDDDDDAVVEAVLSSFDGLHTLTLHVQTRIRPGNAVEPDRDRDREAALDVFGRLVVGRRRRRRPWRRVTINVGGWRRAMVRRMGHGWKRHNEQGVYAERCFWLEADGRGGYSVGEETALGGAICMPPASWRSVRFVAGAD
ncbi:hypothetical protein L249_1866 [Ophiocordyceps polyrhachis-furcata BCC 54312]|uniref:F-box domain-containing protein n=1 Tax=Ophiocordyceps polyrhachis-furcata BCC 54312 TaxID=1330021 RepID=A0A367LRU4_9HYPO|nr:hypothetical protein L249_1866 [Ophiocordyceps polyrhachis-furcata BCC 54312]